MRSAPVVPFVIAVVALAARLPLYLAARPLWLDEALLAENVVDPVRGLFDPLVNLQTAPIGFLLPVQLLVRGMGYGELVLRFLPLLAGLATVAMVWLAARRFAGDSAAAYAAGLAAVSPLLIRYSNELKPYAFDALLAACAIWLSLWAVEELTWARWRRVIAAGSVIVFSSVPGIFLAWGVALAALFANTADRS
ncbi:MAG: glycosyltransferase family 39 protein, partial [Gemmatimonadota bacterium]